MQAERNTLVALSNVLKEHLAVIPEANVGTWLGGVRVAFGRLKKHLESNFVAQEEGGYLEQVIERRPTLAAQLEQCRHEHGELLRLAERVDGELSETSPDDRLLLREVTERIQRYLALAADHDRRENIITLAVFNQDIGSGD